MSKILVIGDAILDIDIFVEQSVYNENATGGHYEEIERFDMLGGAANVAHILSLLGNDVSFVFVTDNHNGKTIESLCRNKNIIPIGINKYTPQSDNRSVLAFKRVHTNPHEHILFIEKYDTPIHGNVIEDTLNRIVSPMAGGYDACVVVDMGIGMFRCMKNIIKTMNDISNVIPLIVSPEQHAGNPNVWRNVNAHSLVMSDQEAEQYKNNYNGLSNVVITSSSGASVRNAGEAVDRFIFGSTLEHAQTIGAGDSFISAYTTSICMGSSVFGAAKNGVCFAHEYVRRPRQEFYSRDWSTFVDD